MISITCNVAAMILTQPGKGLENFGPIYCSDDWDSHHQGEASHCFSAFTAGTSASISIRWLCNTRKPFIEIGGSFRLTKLFLFWLESLRRQPAAEVLCGYELTSRWFWRANCAKKSTWAPLSSASRTEQTPQIRRYPLFWDTSSFLFNSNIINNRTSEGR